MTIRKLFRRMIVVVSVAEGLPDPVGEAELAAVYKMAQFGMRPGKPRFVEFEEFWGQRFVKFSFRAYPRLRGWM